MGKQVAMRLVKGLRRLLKGLVSRYRKRRTTVWPGAEGGRRHTGSR